MTVKEARFSLNIPAHRYLSYYQGIARNVIATAHDGTKVQFPAESLRRYLTHDGVHGEFVLRYDAANNRLLSLERVGDAI